MIDLGGGEGPVEDGTGLAARSQGKLNLIPGWHLGDLINHHCFD